MYASIDWLHGGFDLGEENKRGTSAADRVLRERLERLERVYARLPVLLAAMTCRHEWTHVEHELVNYAILALDEFDASLQEPFTLPAIEG